MNADDSKSSAFFSGAGEFRRLPDQPVSTDTASVEVTPAPIDLPFRCESERRICLAAKVYSS